MGPLTALGTPRSLALHSPILSGTVYLSGCRCTWRVHVLFQRTLPARKSPGLLSSTFVCNVIRESREARGSLGFCSPVSKWTPSRIIRVRRAVRQIFGFALNSILTVTGSYGLSDKSFREDISATWSGTFTIVNPDGTISHNHLIVRFEPL